MAAPGIAARLSLVDLGHDLLVPFVLQQLQAQDLQALKNSCKQLHAWVSELPAAVWHAVGVNTFPYHPPMEYGPDLQTLPAVLAWQAAMGAGSEAAGSTWRCESHPRTQCGEEGSAPEAVERVSHDGRILARVRVTREHKQPPKPQLAFVRLQGADPCQAPARLPPSCLLRQRTRVCCMEFSPDDSCLALLLHPQGRRGAPPEALRVIAMPCVAAPYHTFDLPAGWRPAQAELQWTKSSHRLCVRVPMSAGGPTHIWVFDDRLTPLANLCGLGNHCCWRPTSDSLPLRNTSSTVWQCSRSPQGSGRAAPKQLHGFEQVAWGFLPGTGEVILASRRQKGEHSLHCCFLDAACERMAILGTFIGSASLTWAARQHHVAVSRNESCLEFYVLEAGPRLQLMHSLGPCISDVREMTFSADGRYLLYEERKPGPVIVQASTGCRVALLEHVSLQTLMCNRRWYGPFEAIWVPGGVRMAFEENFVYLFST